MTAEFFNRTFSEWTGYIILLTGFVFTLIVQLGFYLRLLLRKNSADTEQEKTVSVLLCVRNEEGRIEQVLTWLVNQDFKNSEVVVVDDFSEDATLTYIGVLSEKYPKIRFSSLTQETLYSEKISINLALKAAKYDHVVFVNPEMAEINPSYLSKMSNMLSDNDSIVFAYTNYEVQEGFYNCISRIERFLSFLTSAAFSLVGSIVVYNQNNVLFPKQDYFNVGGFRGNMNAHFANLELILNQTKNRKVAVSFDAETQIRENVEVQKKDFIELVRKRLLLTRRFNFGKRLILSLDKISGLLLLAGFLWLLITELQFWMIFSIPIVIALIVKGIILNSILKRLNERKIFLSSFIYGWMRPVIDLIFQFKIHSHFQRYKWN